MYPLVLKAFKGIHHHLSLAFNKVDIEKANLIEHQINKKRNALRKQHVEDLKEKKYKHKRGTYYSDMFSITEKIGDYIINVRKAI